MKGIAAVGCAGLMIMPLMGMAMEPMGDAALSGVTGREGAVLELSLDLNANDNGLLDESVSEVERRWALQYANRGWEGGFTGGDWLVATDFKLILDIPYLGLNSGDSPSSYNHGQGKADYLGAFDPYGNPVLALNLDEPLELGMNNGLAITRDSVSNGSITTPGWARTDIQPFVGIRIGDADVDGQGKGPTDITLNGTGHLFGYSND